MKVKCFFDSNVLVYALKKADSKRDIARQLLSEGGTISVQTVNEFTSVARRKLRMPWTEIVDALNSLRSLCAGPVSLTVKTHERALELAQRWGYHIYDSMILASALEARCETLYSEDMQDGQVVESIMIRNPFIERAPLE